MVPYVVHWSLKVGHAEDASGGPHAQGLPRKFKKESGGLASVLGACGRTGVELLILFGVLF